MASLLILTKVAESNKPTLISIDLKCVTVQKDLARRKICSWTFRVSRYKKDEC
jgi:hypothetical protein